ncbi:MAG: hypothetical protein JNK63_00795 [Chthonomonas sp.]|nr:hypothetical protein [Chthonomonas sp.]
MFARSLIFWLCAAVPVIGAAGSQNWNWINRNLIDRIQVSGYRRLGYHIRSVSGDREAYNVTNYSGLGHRPFTDVGQLQISGRRVFGLFNFEAAFLDSRFTDPTSQKFSIDYEQSGWKVNLGDIQGSMLNTNRFASFSRTLRGAQVGYKSGNFQARAVTSQAKARAETVAIPGNGSSGPYYLQTNQIVPESERIQVDGLLMQRGRDYTISYEVGSITFTTLAVAPSSTIAVTFEAYGMNSQRGTIDGAGLSYDFGKGGKVGLTAMRQVARNSSFGSTRLDKFFGFGPPSTPYTLYYEPLTSRPIIVRVNGVLQTEGVDYYFDVDNAATFFFTRFMPSTDEIDVVYTPKPRQTVDGDREVVGLDYRLPLGKNGAISYALANGKLKNELNPSRGLAQGLTLDFSQGAWSLRAGARDVPRGFVSVESANFNRNERAGDVALSYELNSRSKISANHAAANVTTRTVDGGGNVVYRQSKVNSSGLVYEITPSETGQPLRLSWDRRQTSILGNPSLSNAFSLATNKGYSNWDYRLSLNHMMGSGPTTFVTNSPQQSFSVSGLTGVASWRPNSRLTLDTALSLNSVRSGGDSGLGRRADLNLAYVPSEKLSVSARFSDTDSGGVNGLGAYNDGTGLGLGSSGFTGTVPGLNFLGATGSRLASLVIDYHPHERFSTGIDAYINRYTGSVSSNSETQGAGLSLFWMMSPLHRFSMRLDTSNTKYLSSPQTSSATLLTASLDGRFSSRMSYAVRTSALLTGGSSIYQQNGFTFEGTASYRLGRRENLFAEFISGTTTGYLPQSDVTAALTYQYQLIDALALNIGYRYRDVRNTGGTSTSGAYRSGSFDMELSFTFPR